MNPFTDIPQILIWNSFKPRESSKLGFTNSKLSGLTLKRTAPGKARFSSFMGFLKKIQRFWTSRLAICKHIYIFVCVCIYNIYMSQDLYYIDNLLSFIFRYCFVENLYRSEVIEASEFEVLSQWFEYVVNSSDIDLEVDLVVYLRTEPEKVQNHFVSLPKKKPKHKIDRQNCKPPLLK